MLRLLARHKTGIVAFHEQLHSDFATILLTPINKIFLYKKYVPKGVYIHIFI